MYLKVKVKFKTDEKKRLLRIRKIALSVMTYCSRVPKLPFLFCGPEFVDFFPDRKKIDMKNAMLLIARKQKNIKILFFCAYLLKTNIIF